MSKIIIRIITKTIFAMNVYIKTNKLKDIKKTFKIYKKKWIKKKIKNKFKLWIRNIMT